MRAANDAGAFDRSVEIVNRQVSGFAAAYVETLRTDQRAWATLRRLSEPLHTELQALSRTDVPDSLGAQAHRLDLILGATNVDSAPYGTTFEDLRTRLPHAAVHHLPDQGHLAHVEAPTALARLLDTLATVRTEGTAAPGR